MAGASEDLTGRVAIVTGGSRGIGHATVRRLAEAGAAVVVAARDVDRCRAVVREIEADGGRALAVECDVSDATDVASLIDQTLAGYRRIDVVVNNAGISPVSREPQDLSEDEWDRILDVNLKGPFLVCRAVAPTLLAQRSGVIINIASIAATMPIPSESAYCASKAGLVGLTRALAFDWAKYGIRVHAVAPGYVATDMNAGVRATAEAYAAVGDAEHADPGAAADDVQAAVSLYGAVVGRTLLGRYGTPEEVADVVCFLASDRAAYMTGAVTYVDGGWTIGEPPAKWP